jgi:hypothetical protein
MIEEVVKSAHDMQVLAAERSGDDATCAALFAGSKVLGTMGLVLTRINELEAKLESLHTVIRALKKDARSDVTP